MKTFPLVPTLVTLLLAILCGSAYAEEEIRPAYRFQAGDVHVFTGEANGKVIVKLGETEKERETRFKMETRAFLLSFERGGTRLGVKERAEKLMEKGNEIQTRWTLGHLDDQGNWKPEDGSLTSPFVEDVGRAARVALSGAWYDDDDVSEEG